VSIVLGIRPYTFSELYPNRWSPSTCTNRQRAPFFAISSPTCTRGTMKTTGAAKVASEAVVEVFVSQI
jgi:hypothetical protein